MENLPPKVFSHILNFLEYTDIFRLKTVSKSLFNAVQDFQLDFMGNIELWKTSESSYFQKWSKKDDLPGAYTNFTFHVNFLSLATMESIGDSFGENALRCKFVITQKPQSISTGCKITKFLSRTKNLSSLIFYIENGEKEIVESISYLASMPNFCLWKLKKLKFEGSILAASQYEFLGRFMSKAPYLEKISLISEPGVIMTKAFQNFIPLIKELFISIEIHNVVDGDTEMIEILKDHRLKIESFKIAVSRTLNSEDDKIEQAFFFDELTKFLESQKETLKSLTIYKPVFKSILHLPSLLNLTELSLSFEISLEDNFEVVRFGQWLVPNLRKLHLSASAYKIFLYNDVRLISVKELIVENLLIFDYQRNPFNQDLTEEIGVSWENIFPNVQSIAITESTPPAEIYVLEKMSQNLIELEMRSSPYIKRSFWNVFVGDMEKLPEETLLGFIEKLVKGKEIETEPKFEARAGKLKNLKTLKLSEKNDLKRGLEIIETLYYLSATEKIHPFDELLIELPKEYEAFHAHPHPFVLFLHAYHKNFKISVASPTTYN